MFLHHILDVSTKYDDASIYGGSTQSTQRSWQFGSTDPAAHTGVIKLCGVQLVRSIMAPCHKEHLIEEMGRIKKK